MGPRPVGDDPRPSEALLVRLCASRRSPKMLRLTTNADSARIDIVAGEKLTPVGAVVPGPVVTPLVLPTSSAFS